MLWRRQSALHRLLQPGAVHQLTACMTARHGAHKVRCTASGGQFCCPQCITPACMSIGHHARHSHTHTPHTTLTRAELNLRQVRLATACSSLVTVTTELYPFAGTQAPATITSARHHADLPRFPTTWTSSSRWVGMTKHDRWCRGSSHSCREGVQGGCCRTRSPLATRTCCRAAVVATRGHSKLLPCWTRACWPGSR
jgi:hypothetical protein